MRQEKYICDICQEKIGTQDFFTVYRNNFLGSPIGKTDVCMKCWECTSQYIRREEEEKGRKEA